MPGTILQFIRRGVKAASRRTWALRADCSSDKLCEMAKPNFIELPGCEPISIIFEDRSVLAIDKPRGWMLVPDSWRKTNWNLQTAIDSSIRADDFWARSRNLRYLRHVHRLDADTSGVMLFAKSEGAMRAMGEMFESRRMEKTYLAVVEGVPREKEWTCELPLGAGPEKFWQDARGHFAGWQGSRDAFPRAGEQRAVHADRGESADGPHASDSRASGAVGLPDHVRRTLWHAWKKVFVSACAQCGWLTKTRSRGGRCTILAPAESFLKEFGIKLTPELEKEKWVRRPFVPKENKEAAKQHRPAKIEPAREDARPTRNQGDVTR